MESLHTLYMYCVDLMHDQQLTITISHAGEYRKLLNVKTRYEAAPQARKCCAIVWRSLACGAPYSAKHAEYF